MTPNNDTTATPNRPTRAHQQDARAWARFTGGKYTEALRQMQSPLAQGLLGERVSARTLIETLTDHEVVAADDVGSVLGDDGYHSDFPWDFDGKTDFIRLALVTEALRMFTPTPGSAEVSSYILKHTVEALLGQHDPDYAYVTNGQLIWAAAALGLKLSTHNADGDGHEAGPNLWVGISETEYDYVDRLIRSEIPPEGHHFRPARYLRLQDVLARAAAGETITEDWIPPVPGETETPFHDWLLSQTDRKDPVGDLSQDYEFGLRAGEHGIAAAPGDMLAILTELDHFHLAYASLFRAITEYAAAVPTAPPIRTMPRDTHTWEADGFGTGAWGVERLEHPCLCSDGSIIETRTTIMGVEEDEVTIDCDRCSRHWSFAEGRSTRDWGLVPKP